jgi:hypothetical protein
MRKDGAMSCIIVLSQKLSGGTEQNVEISLRKAGLKMRFECFTSSGCRWNANEYTYKCISSYIFTYIHSHYDVTYICKLYFYLLYIYFRILSFSYLCFALHPSLYIPLISLVLHFFTVFPFLVFITFCTSRISSQMKWYYLQAQSVH